MSEPQAPYTPVPYHEAIIGSVDATPEQRINELYDCAVSYWEQLDVRTEMARGSANRLAYARARMAEAMQRQDSAERALMQQAQTMAELHKHILGQAITIQKLSTRLSKLEDDGK